MFIIGHMHAWIFTAAPKGAVTPVTNPLKNGKNEEVNCKTASLPTPRHRPWYSCMSPAQWAGDSLAVEGPVPALPSTLCSCQQGEEICWHPDFCLPPPTWDRRAPLLLPPLPSTTEHHNWASLCPQSELPSFPQSAFAGSPSLVVSCPLCTWVAWGFSSSSPSTPLPTPCTQPSSAPVELRPPARMEQHQNHRITE